MSRFVMTIDDDEPLAPVSGDEDDEQLSGSTKSRKKQKGDIDPEFDFELDDEEDDADWNADYQLKEDVTVNKTSDTISKLLERRKQREMSNDNAMDEDGDEDQVDEERGVTLSQLTADIGSDDSDDEEAERLKDEYFETPDVSSVSAASFSALQLSRSLLKGITAMGFAEPTPVQSATIPVALAGRDICACAATGSGKTAAFMLPVLERLLYRPKRVAQTRVLVLSPTRELAVQVATAARALAKFTDITFGLAIGGMSLKVQEAELRTRPDVIVATPGRLVDHIQNTHSFDLSTIEVLIMDEADRLLEVGFGPQLDMIISSCSKQRQTMLFSATMTDEVEDLIKLSLNTPIRLFVDRNKKVTDNLVQEFVRIRPQHETSREAIVLSLVKRTHKSHCLVFVRSKKHAHRLRIVFGLADIKAGELHGSLTQAQRMDALERFKNDDLDVLICSDLAGRGLDIPGVKSVINLSMPNTVKQYIHRVGRTARGGSSGRSVTLVGEGERKLLRELYKNNSSSMRNRVIKTEVIAKFKSFIDALKDDIQEIMQQELEDKEITMALMEAKKAENLILHKDEIKSRAPRKWIETPEEKAQSAEQSRQAHEGATSALPSGAASGKAQRAQKAAAAKAKMDPEVAHQLALARQLKRNRKPKKIKTFREETGKPTPQAKRAKKQPGFDSEASSAGKGNVRTTPAGLMKKSSAKKAALKEAAAKKRVIPGAKGAKKFKSKQRYRRR
eukprot:TRINITY_DN11925_c0_g1_i3.p1 TRINITY_DN11925_c0_g1~~TRINITY_DN11925_c0_g1_i3.p1  ORF type:complete len:732 (+),score=192.36 TRINITY_DN11925_c0_g1_i3:41-2236(+)